MIKKGLKHTGYNKKTGRPEFLVTGEGPDMVSELLGESPTVKLWTLLWEWGSGDIDGTRSDFARCGNISRTSLNNILPTFLEHEWIIPSRCEKGTQYYKLNKHHFVAKALISVIREHVYTNLGISMAEEDAKDEMYLEWKKKQKKKKKKVKKK